MEIFLYSCVYSWDLFLISSASVRFIPFLSFIVPSYSLGISNFLEEFSSLSHSIVFLFICIDHWGRLSYLSLLFYRTLHSDGYIFPFILYLSLLFYSPLFVSPPQTTILSFCISFLGGLFWWQPPVQCYGPHSIFLQTLCLSYLIPWICPLQLYSGSDK